MATGELRERVRERLVERPSRRSRRGSPERRRPAGDEVIALLTSGARPRWSSSAASALANAIANFDAATIATTHGFCQEVLAELGTLGDLEPDVDVRRETSTI